MVRGADLETVRRGTAVRVDDHDDDLVAARVRVQPFVQRAVGGVERVPLARPRLRTVALHQVQVRVEVAVAAPQRAHYAGGAVLRIVVDDPDVGGAKGLPQVADRFADDGLLVAARHEEVPREVGRITGGAALAAQVRDDDHRDVDEEPDTHGQREGLRDGEKDLDVHADLRVASQTKRTSDAAPPKTLTREPSSVWPQ